MTRTIGTLLSLFGCLGMWMTSGAQPEDKSSTNQPLGYNSLGDDSLGHGVLLVANKGDRTVGIIDPRAGRQVGTIPEAGVTAHEVVTSPDGRLAYAPLYGKFRGREPRTGGEEH